MSNSHIPDLNGTIEKQARYIMDTGKLIHDRVSQIFTGHVAGSRKKELHELSPSQLHALKAIWKRDGVTITEIAQILEVSPPSASVMVDRLVERGIMTRERSREDRRKVVVRISDDVEEDIKKIEQKILNSFIDLIQQLGPETTRKWCEVLSQVKEVFTAKQTEKNRG